MFLLARWVCKDNRAAFVAGVIYGFSPYLFAHAYPGHVNLIHVEFIPIFILEILRYLEEEKFKHLLLASLSLAAIMLCSLYYLLYMLLFLLVCSIWEVRQSWRDVASVPSFYVRSYAKLFLILFIAVFPFSMEMALWLPKSGYMRAPVEHTVAFSSDFFSFFMPSFMHPVFGRVHRSIRFSGNPWKQTNYLGYTPLFLSVYILYIT